MYGAGGEASCVVGGVVGVGECLLCGALCSGVVGGAEVVECGEAEAGEVAECAVDAGDGEVAVESGEVDGEAVVAGVCGGWLVVRGWWSMCGRRWWRSLGPWWCL